MKLLKAFDDPLGQLLEVLPVNHQVRRLSEEHNPGLTLEESCDTENLGRFPARTGRQRGGCGFTYLLHQELQPGFRFSPFQNSQELKRGSVPGTVLGRLTIQHASATNGCDGRELANNEAVAGYEQTGLREAELNKASRTRRQFFAVEQPDLGQHLRGPAMEVHPRAIPQRARAGQKVHRTI